VEKCAIRGFKLRSTGLSIAFQTSRVFIDRTVTGLLWNIDCKFSPTHVTLVLLSVASKAERTLYNIYIFKTKIYDLQF
jgi:hypothetical protein